MLQQLGDSKNHSVPGYLVYWHELSKRAYEMQWKQPPAVTLHTPYAESNILIILKTVTSA